jgi:hypothetical protein
MRGINASIHRRKREEDREGEKRNAGEETVDTKHNEKSQAKKEREKGRKRCKMDTLGVDELPVLSVLCVVPGVLVGIVGRLSGVVLCHDLWRDSVEGLLGELSEQVPGEVERVEDRSGLVRAL